jgi:septal ring factor EnvC (AmiA/AmiB activator)
LHIEELQRRILRLEIELQESSERQHQLLEEKNKIINDNLDFTQELRKTKKELTKLQEFKRAIMSTFEGEETGEVCESSKFTTDRIQVLKIGENYEYFHLFKS